MSAGYRTGANGSHVAALQNALIARGFAIPAGATGFFGTQTRAAVAGFQRSQGWNGSGADGIPGPQTLARLGVTGAAPPSAPPIVSSTPISASGYSPGSVGPHIANLQRTLVSRGFSIPAGATGTFGPQTRAAVAAFQRSQGWTGSGADGIPGPQTLARLNSASADSVPAAFVSQHGAAIRAATAGTGVPPLVAVAQAALESGWGTSAAGNNYFGVKALPTDPADSKTLRLTTEVLPTADAVGFPEVVSVTPRPDGLYTLQVRDWFRVYESPQASFAAHAALLQRPRYLPAHQHSNDPYRFAAAIAAAGYATDPSYTQKLHEVMRLIEGLGYR